MRPNLTSDPAYARAVRDFVARLARARVAVPGGVAADACILLDAARTRGEILSAAGAIAGFLAGKGISVSRDLVLEGAAAFRGLRSWGALSAKAPRSLGYAAIEEQEDILHLLLREEGGPALPSGEPVLWSYRAPDADDLRVVITPRAVHAVAGRGLHRSLLGTRPVRGDQHRKEAEWEANGLAKRWLIDVPSAKRLLTACGFAVVSTGGGLTGWFRQAPAHPGLETLITDAESSTHHIGVRDALLVGVRGDGVDECDAMIEAEGIAGALDALPGLLARVSRAGR